MMTEEKFFEDLQKEDKIVKNGLRLEKYIHEIQNMYMQFVPSKPEFYHNQPTPKRFVNTHLFREMAIKKESTGRYNDFPQKSKPWYDLFKRELYRCKYGMTINKGTEDEVSITGLHYFFLNYKTMKIKKIQKNGEIIRKDGLPDFWALHYNFFWALNEAQIDKEHFVILKPRGTGFSEIFATIGSYIYTFYKSELALFFAASKNFIEKDGIFSKISVQLDYLNTETDGMFKHLRTINSDADYHKKAGIITKTGEKKATGGEIIASVVDNPNKVRGGRSKLVAFEEAGSFPKLIEAFNAAVPLVSLGGEVFGNIFMWGTGGEIGQGIFGLKTIFNSPTSYGCKKFTNYWDLDLKGSAAGFFFPTYAAMDKYMDKDGNMDEYSAFVHLCADRLIAMSSPEANRINGLMAEYPICPAEALQRTENVVFPVRLLTNQKMKIISEGKTPWVHGDMGLNENGFVDFIPNPKSIPIDVWPIKKENFASLKGCVSIKEAPEKDSNGNVPKNLYILSVDPYQKDVSEWSDSVGAVYVYKRNSGAFKTKYSGTAVARFVGRPKVADFWNQVFMLAEYYGCKVQSEVSGGGSTGIELARKLKKTSLLAETINIDSNKEKHSKVRTYFLNSSDDKEENGLMYLVDWLLTEIEKIEVDGKAQYILNLHTIDDLGFIEEMLNFVDDKKYNFDRIDSWKILMRQLQQVSLTDVKERKKKREYFNSVNWFTNASK